MGANGSSARALILLVVALVVMAAMSAAFGATGPEAALPIESPEGEGELQALFYEVATIHLLNGLHLTREQAESIVALAREAHAGGKSTAEAEAYRKALAEAKAVYEALKAESNKGEPPGAALSRRAVDQAERLKDARIRYAGALDQLLGQFDARLRKVLDEGQLEVVETFRPCLVPPRDLRDPVRAGQAEGDRGTEMLTRWRRMPERFWQERKDEMAERYTRSLEGGRLVIADESLRAAEKARFVATVEKARAMSDVEFEIEKPALAQELNPHHRLNEFLKAPRPVRDAAAPQHISPAVRWLLHPRIIPLLEERLKHGA